MSAWTCLKRVHSERMSWKVSAGLSFMRDVHSNHQTHKTLVLFSRIRDEFKN